MRVIIAVLTIAMLTSVGGAAAVGEVPEGDVPLHWLPRDGWLYVGVGGVDHLGKRASLMSVFAPKKDTRAIFATAATFGRGLMRRYFQSFTLTEAEVAALSGRIEQVHLLVGGRRYRAKTGKAHFRCALLVRYRNPMGAKKVFSSREGTAALEVAGRVGGTPIFWMEGFDGRARFVAFKNRWMICMSDRARIEAILAGKLPKGASFADHPLLVRRVKQGGKTGRPLLPPHSDFNIVYDTAAHLSQIRANIGSRRIAAAASGAVEQWNRKLAEVDGWTRAFALGGVRGMVLMSQLNVKGDGGTVVDVRLAPGSPWLGLAKQRVGTGRLLRLLPASAPLCGITNSDRPLALLDAISPLSRLPGLGAADGQAVGLLLSKAGEPLKRLMLGYVADAAFAELPAPGAKGRSELVLCLGLNDPKAAQGAFDKVVAALKTPADGRKGARVVQNVRHAGREIKILSDAGVEGADLGLLAWTRVSDTLVIGSVAGVKRVVADYRGGMSLLADENVAGELVRTPGGAGQLVVLWPGRWITRFAPIGLENVFAADFPVLIKAAPVAGGIRLRSNISLPALASTWGVGAFIGRRGKISPGVGHFDSPANAP